MKMGSIDPFIPRRFEPFGILSEKSEKDSDSQSSSSQSNALRSQGGGGIEGRGVERFSQ
jgi:hypothetical protein